MDRYLNRKYPCSREWRKEIRYNNHMYTLRSVFDDLIKDYDDNTYIADDANREEEIKKRNRIRNTRRKILNLD